MVPDASGPWRPLAGQTGAGGPPATMQRARAERQADEFFASYTLPSSGHTPVEMRSTLAKVVNQRLSEPASRIPCAVPRPRRSSSPNSASVNSAPKYVTRSACAVSSITSASCSV